MTLNAASEYGEKLIAFEQLFERSKQLPSQNHDEREEQCCDCESRKAARELGNRRNYVTAELASDFATRKCARMYVRVSHPGEEVVRELCGGTCTDGSRCATERTGGGGGHSGKRYLNSSIDTW